MDKKNDSNQNKKNRFVSWKYFVFITLVIIGLISFFVLKEDNIQTTRVSYQEIVSGFETEGLVIRDEKTFKAPMSGEINILKNEGERAAYGEQIAYIENDDQKYNIYSKEPGIISYAHDGLEQSLRFGSITPKLLDNYNDFERNYKQYVSGNSVEKGAILYRIINNYNQYLLIEVEDEKAQMFKQNETVFLDRDDEKKYIKAKIKKIYEYKDMNYLLLDLNYYVKEWNNIRWVDIKLIKNIYEGLAVPNSSIFKTANGTKILLYTFDNEIKMKDINVIETTNKWSIIENVDIGDKVIINPENVNYGRNEN